MRVGLRFFAAAREAMGRTAMPLDAPPGATVADVLARLRADSPAFAALPQGMLVSVNLEYRTADWPLADGDEVAFIPPVSGGCNTCSEPDTGSARPEGRITMVRPPA